MKPDEAKTICIFLPLPPRALSPNARIHWAIKARATKAYRRTCYIMALAAPRTTGKPRWSHAIARATFYHAQRRRRDGDNLLASLKAAFDGIVDAGLLLDDAGLTHLPVRQEIDRDNPRVEILIKK